MLQRRSFPTSMKLLIALMLIITFLPSLVVRLLLQEQLQQLGAQRVDVRVFHLNLWNGRLTLKGLRADSDDHPTLMVNELIADIDYSALFAQQFHLSELRLQGIRLPLREQAGLWQLGPLKLPTPEPSPAEEEQPETAASPWRWGVSAISFSDIDLPLSYQNSQHRLQLETLRLPQLFQWAPEELSQIQLQGQLNGSPFALNGDSRPLATLPSATTHLQLQRLDLGPLLALLQRPEQLTLSLDLKLGFQQTAAEDFTLSAEGRIELFDLKLPQPDLSLTTPLVSWQGLNTTQLKGGALAENHTEGTLTIDALDLHLTSAPSSNAAPSALQLQTNAALELSLDLNNAASGMVLTQRSTLILSDLALKQPELKLQSAQLTWQGDSSLLLSPSNQLQQINSDGKLQLNQLLVEQPQLRLQQQAISLSGALALEPGKQLQFDGALGLKQLQLLFQHLAIEAEQQAWQGRLGLNLSEPGLQQLSGTLQLQNVAVANPAQAAQLSLARMELSEFSLDATQRLQAQQFNLEQLAIRQPAPLLDLQRLQLQQLSGSSEQVRIGSIELGGLDAQVILDRKQQPHTWLEWVAAMSGTPLASTATASNEQSAATQSSNAASVISSAAGSAPTAPDPEPLFPFALGQLHLSAPVKLSLTDQRIKAGRPISLTLTQLDIAQVDTRSEAPTRFELKAQLNRFGDIHSQGTLTLFNAHPSGDWHAAIDQLELPAFSPYMNIHTGYLINNGQLNLDSHGTLTHGQLQSETKLILNQFEVERSKATEANEFNGQLGMPLELAVSILTDKENNVELDIPVNGSLQDPEFGIQSVVNILLGKIAKEGAMSYLSYTLQPYGALLSLGRLALDAAEGAALALEAVPFEPGSAQLTPPAVGYLDKLNQLLSQRQGLKLKLCGQAVGADRDYLLQLADQIARQAGKPRTQIIDTTQLHSWLYQLAESRGETVKGYLQQQHKIDGKRLFSCLPKVEELSQAAPRVQVGL